MLYGLTEKEYRPKYPDSPFIHIADLVNKTTGKTYREENAEKVHSIALGSLVEIRDSEDDEQGGVRLFVVKLGRDCDETPLYWLSPYTPAEERKFDYLTCHRIGGYGEESLIVIRTA